MRPLLLSIFIPLVSCDSSKPEATSPEAKQEPAPTEQAAEEPVFPERFDGAWVMSAKWRYTMGVAIAISGDRYYYWMYSDVGGPDEAVGKCRIEGDVLILDPPDSGKNLDEYFQLYSDRWRILRLPTATALTAVAKSEGDPGRMLLPDFRFDPRNPSHNQEHLQPLPQ